ncbi:MAG: sensor histidine kinase [Chthoniobacteraceae bacterium]
MMRLVFAAFWLAVPGAAPGQAEGDVLTTVLAVRQLPIEQAAKHLPVRLRGVVTYSEPERTATFIADDTGGIYVAYGATEPTLRLAPGTRVEVAGVSDSGHFANIVLGPDGRSVEMTVLGAGAPPEPRAVSGAELEDPGADCEWVAVEAHVRTVFIADEAVVLECFAEPCAFHAILAGPLQAVAPPWHLVGSRVRLRGVVATTFNRERQMTRRLLRVSSLADITTLQPGPPPGEAPRITRADELLQVNGPKPTDLVSVHGVATMALPGRGIFLRTASGALWVATTQLHDVRAGSKVTVDGWPRMGATRPFVQAREAGVVGWVEEPAPLSVTATAACDARYEAELVSVEAELLESVRGTDGVTLEMRDGATIFRCHAATVEGLPRLRPGSRLRVTGIAQITASREFQPIQVPDKLFIRLRTGRDVEVLALPSPWTTRNVLIGSGAIVGIMLGALGRLHAQRRRERAAQRRASEAVLAERSRLARDMHDQLGANLTQISISSQLVKLDPPGAVAGHAEEISAVARDTIESLDQIVWAVNPRHDTLASLIEYLDKFAVRFLTSSGIAAKVEIPHDLPPLPLGSNVRHHLFLVVREALNNVVKHAGASTVWLNVEMNGGVLRASVRDDGRGFQQSEVEADSNGLRNMRERMAEIGGDCRIDASSTAGTRIVFEWPLPATET